MEKLEPRCLVCNFKTRFFSKFGSYQIYRCPKCGLGQTLGLGPQTNKYHRDQTYLIEEKLFKNIFLKRVKMISQFSKPSRALEIGCSTGLMLSLLRMRGFEVMGIEMSQEAAGVAKARGIDVVVVPFEKVKLNQKFDLVIFNHTLEHLPDPLEALKKAKLLLRLNGILFIDLPNFDSLVAKILKDRWPLLLPEEHLWHFTRKSLSLLLSRLDFKILKTEKASGLWDVDNPVLELWFSFSGLKKRFFVNLITAIPSLILDKLGWGSGLTIIARKR